MSLSKPSDGEILMKKDIIRGKLELLYLNFYNRKFSEDKLKHMLKELYLESKLEINEWSEMVLDSQWIFAKDVDYENKIWQLSEAERNDPGFLSFCSCGGMLLQVDQVYGKCVDCGKTMKLDP